MKYFKLFNFPAGFKTDKAALRKEYFSLSKQAHPDYFVNTGADEQQNALDASAQLNKAFKTLSNEEATLEYILKEKGLIAENEKYTLPPLFLGQMLELNEQLAEAAFDESGVVQKQAADQLQESEKEIYESVQPIMENYKEGVTSEEELLQLKDYYYKKKYLQRVALQLAQKL